MYRFPTCGHMAERRAIFRQDFSQIDSKKFVDTVHIRCGQCNVVNEFSNEDLKDLFGEAYMRARTIEVGRNHNRD